MDHVKEKLHGFFSLDETFVCTDEKIEGKSLHLPKVLLEPETKPCHELVYIKVFEVDTLRAQHLEESIAAKKAELKREWFWNRDKQEVAKAKITRKIYRIRDLELVKFVGQGFENVAEIQKASKATLTLFADTESNLRRHSYLDLVGTVYEVETAEKMIIDKIKEKYGENNPHPVLLMPTKVYEDHLIIKRNKIDRSIIFGIELNNRCWIRLEPGAPPGGSEDEGLVKVFGLKNNVIKAVLILRVLSDQPTYAAPVVQPDAGGSVAAPADAGGDSVAAPAQSTGDENQAGGGQAPEQTTGEENQPVGGDSVAAPEQSTGDENQAGVPAEKRQHFWKEGKSDDSYRSFNFRAGHGMMPGSSDDERRLLLGG